MPHSSNHDALIAEIARLEKELKTLKGSPETGALTTTFELTGLEHAADGICVCHAIEDFPYVRFIFWNRRMVELTGYSLEEINRRGWYQSVYPDPAVQAKAIARMDQMRDGINLAAEEWEITCADGRCRTLRISTSRLKDAGGTPRVMAVMQDMTDSAHREARLLAERQTLQRQLARQSKQLADAETALKVSDARYRALFEVAEDALFIENDQDQIVEVNRKACELLGYDREELLSMTIADIQAPECRGTSGTILSTEMAQHRGHPFETLDLHKDGTPIPVEVTNTRLAEAGLVLSIVRDIRDRQEAEQARRETAYIIDKSPVVAFLWRNEPNWPVEFVTPNVERVLGYSAADFLKGRILYSSVVHPEDLERVADEVATYSDMPDRTEFVHAPYRIITQAGHTRWIKDQTFIRRNSSGAITHYQGIVEDITARITAEQALRESEEKFSRVFHLNPDTVIITRLADGVILDVNESFEKATGYSRQEAVGRASIADLNLWAIPEERDRYVAEVLRHDMVRNMELQFRLKNGKVRTGAVSGALIDIEGERCIVATIRDVTEDRRAAAHLAEEKERLAVTLRSIGDAVITTDRNSRIVLLNPVAERLTGWTEAQAVGRQLMEVFHIVNDRTGEPCANPVDKVLSSGQIVGLANHTVLVARNGSETVIADSGAPITDQQGAIIGVVLVFRDITDQERIEKELLKMEKLKSLGVLAGGIAHDFNNFLTGIIGNLSLARIDAQQGHPITRELNEMEKAALRAKDLTQQLLTFSKGGTPIKRVASIADLVRESGQFAVHGSNVRCIFDLDEGLHPTEVDEGQIAQVIQNLVINADQAMASGGTVHITGINVSLPPDNPFALTPGSYVQVSIKDNGAGIHPDHVKRIFDPYFTTKQKGSGLGLAVAYSIVAKHDGQLTVASTLGEGTTFTLLLPASEHARVTPATDDGGLVAGQGRVLVMDDEDFIRELAAIMLQKMGYEVTLAEDGQSAIDAYAEALDAGAPFKAVILDLTVPGGMGGKDAVQQITAIDADACVIVSSGYSNDPVMADYAAYGFSGAIKKPYQAQEMSQVLSTAATPGKRPSG